MMDLSDGTGGLSYIKYERQPSPHILVFENATYERDDISLTWSWATGVFIEPGERWSSCAFGVGVHQGDWHETADRMRRWLGEWWTPCDTPPALRERIGLLHVHTHGFSGDPHHEFSELPAIARDAMRYGVRDLMIWDNTASVYFRPDRGDFWEMSPAREQELRRAIAELKQLGCWISSFVNWRLLAEYNRTWESLKPLVQESLFGAGMYGFPPGTLDGGWYNDPAYEMGSRSVCCGADQFLPYARRVLNRTLDLGFNAIAVDQAAEPNYCLSRNHGHASPWEAWARTYDWFAEVTRSARARQADAYTIAELPDLYNTQYIDLWWCWGWRGGGASAEVFRYVLPTMIPCWCIDENQRDVIAEAFAIGSFLAIAARDMTGLLSDAPKLAAQVARLAQLRKATAPFVSHGRFMHHRGLSVQSGNGYVYTSDSGLAVALANRKPRKARMEMVLSPGALGRDTVGACTLHVEGAAPIFMSPARTGDTISLTIELPARGAGVLTFDSDADG
jgi:hypothetical protein